MLIQQKRRAPWLAAFLSLYMPGLGQIYNGQGKKGLFILLLAQPILWLTVVVIILFLHIAPLNIMVPMLIVLGIYLYVPIEAFLTARRLGSYYPLKSYNRWYVYLAVCLVAGFAGQALAALVRSSVIQTFKIPSGAMERTILVGDHIVVNKLLYRSAPPERFNIIVFQYPWEKERDFIKRVIALPGDRVEIRNQQVFVNDQALHEPYAQYMAARTWNRKFGPLIVPKKGDIVEIRQDGYLYLNELKLHIPLGRYYPRDDGPAMTGFKVFYGSLFPIGTTLAKPTGPLVVQHDYYFTLGDNRDNSKDSRYWGFVEETLIKGKVTVIYWSWNRYALGVRKVRWGRIGMRLD
jgi:signal peptidase I